MSLRNSKNSAIELNEHLGSTEKDLSVIYKTHGTVQPSKLNTTKAQQRRNSQTQHESNASPQSNREKLDSQSPSVLGPL